MEKKQGENYFLPPKTRRLFRFNRYFPRAILTPFNKIDIK